MKRGIGMNRIKELRKQKGVTMDGLADYMGVSQGTIVHWENGSSQVKQDKSQKLANYFNVSEAYLLCYSDNDNQKLDWDSVVGYLSKLSEFDYKKMIEVVDNKREE